MSSPWTVLSALEPALVIPPEVSPAQARTRLVHSQARYLILADRTQVRGIFSADDLSEVDDGAVLDGVLPPFPDVRLSAAAPLSEASDRLRQWSVRRLPVVDARGQFVGVVTTESLLCTALAEAAALRQAKAVDDGPSAGRFDAAAPRAQRDPAGDDPPPRTSAVRMDPLQRVVIDALPMFVSYVDRHLTYLWVNQRYVDLLARPRTEIQGRRVAEIHDEAWCQQIQPDLQRALTGHPGRFQYRKAAADAEYVFDVRYLPDRDAAGEVVGCIVLGEDITELHSARRQLADSEARLRAIFEADPECIRLLDREGRVLAINAAGLKHFEAESADQLLGRSILTFVDPADRDQVQAWHDGLLTGNAGPIRFQITGLRGTRRWLESNGALLRKASGDVEAVVVVTRDITEQRRIEEQLHAQRDELHHALRHTALGEMAAGIAHELNQPLSAIATYAYTVRQLLRDAAVDPGAVDALEKLELQALRAGEIIRRMRRLLRHSDALHVDCDLNQIVSEILSLVQGELLLAQIQLQTELAADLPQVRADAVEIQLVLINLIRNAIDALADQRPDQRQIRVTTSQLSPENAALVSIEDSGCGLPEGFNAAKLEPFHSSKPQGLGLGLAICRRIVESHQGILWHESPPQGGAVFRFALPSAAADVG